MENNIDSLKKISKLKGNINDFLLLFPEKEEYNEYLQKCDMSLKTEDISLLEEFSGYFRSQVFQKEHKLHSFNKLMILYIEEKIIQNIVEDI